MNDHETFLFSRDLGVNPIQIATFSVLYHIFCSLVRFLVLKAFKDLSSKDISPKTFWQRDNTNVLEVTDYFQGQHAKLQCNLYFTIYAHETSPNSRKLKLNCLEFSF